MKWSVKSSMTTEKTSMKWSVKSTMTAEKTSMKSMVSEINYDSREDVHDTSML